jgi:hypothetical protein
MDANGEQDLRDVSGAWVAFSPLWPLRIGRPYVCSPLGLGLTKTEHLLLGPRHDLAFVSSVIDEWSACPGVPEIDMALAEKSFPNFAQMIAARPRGTRPQSGQTPIPKTIGTVVIGALVAIAGTWPGVAMTVTCRRTNRPLAPAGDRTGLPASGTRPSRSGLRRTRFC